MIPFGHYHFNSLTARTLSALFVASVFLSQKKKEGKCVYFRFLRKIAIAAMTTITATAATAI